VQRLQLLLALADGASIDELVDVAFGEISYVREQERGEFRLALLDGAAREAGFPMGVPEFEVIAEYGVPDELGAEPLVRRAKAIGPKLAGLIDPARSAAVLGREYTLTPGDGPFELFRCLSRRSDHTLEAFAAHWLGPHGDLGKQVPGKPGYRQLHRNPEAQTAAARAAGVQIDTVDGVATLLFPDARGIRLLGTDPEHSRKTAEDGALFVDRTKAMGNISHVVAVAGPLVPFASFSE
jgi:hypothetical protein